MDSACSLSSTHRIVLFGRIFPPGIFLPSLAGAKASLEFFYCWVLLLGFEHSTASYKGKQVTGTPTGGKLCGRLWSGSKCRPQNAENGPFAASKIFRRKFSLAGAACLATSGFSVCRRLIWC